MSTPSSRDRTQAHPMLFDVAGGPSPEAEPADPGGGRPRLRTANRQQIVSRAAPLDTLIPGDHPARVVRDYVEGLDLDPLYDRIKAIEGRPGRAPIDPKILMASWLYATVEGVGSARQLDELCRDHAAFRWLVGGFRPAYDLQFSTATDSRVIVGADVEMTGSDAGQLVPMVEQVKGRYEMVPDEALVDGGFAQHDRIEAVSGPGMGCTVYAPVPRPKGPQVDRHAPKPGDGAAVAAWRPRMGTGQAKAISKGRASTAECVNARTRGRGLLRLLVRGVAKVKAIASWHASAHNLLRAASPRAAVAGTT